MVSVVSKHTILLLLVMQVVLISPCFAQENIPREVEVLMRDLEYLHSKGVNVDEVVDLLNKALDEYGKNNTQRALEYFKEAKQRINSLKAEAQYTYMTVLITKALTVVSLISIPLLLYLLLPKVYLYIWFKLHRNWIVR